MIIIFGNQKGGAGKSTLALLFANFLTLFKYCPVTLIDMDDQQSLWQKYEKAKLLENAEPYEVIPATLESYPLLGNVLAKNTGDILLIDLPGKLDDDRLIPVFNSAHLVICPFSYDEFSFGSTVHFAVVTKKINPKIDIVFVPNRVKTNARCEVIQEVNTQLSKFGKITPILPDRVDFQRTSTCRTPLSLVPVLYPVFGQIFTDHIRGKN